MSMEFDWVWSSVWADKVETEEKSLKTGKYKKTMIPASPPFIAL